MTMTQPHVDGPVTTSMQRRQVGDILVSLWGYERTNVNFYQVVAVISKATISIRRIGSERLDGDRVVPMRDEFLVDDEVDGRRYRLTRGGGVRFNYYRRAGLWTGEPMYESHPDVGH